MPRTARVILLNGCGSVGKSSVARALQGIVATPLLVVAMDDFLDMLPPGLMGHPDGLVFADEGAAGVAVRSGPVLDRAMRGMRRAVAALAAAGNDLVVDEVMLDAEKEADYRAVLATFELHMVGLFAPLEVIEARERARGDRMIGLARWQYGRVHAGRRYELELDAGSDTPETLAEAIRERFGL
jgi:chloramphenicol 3-O phosphotransferase